ncbi:MAG TPA: signal peptidase I [Bdellovibrionota bacterium]
MKRRKPWLAFVLTQLCPGLGQLYNGDVRWTVISFVLSLAFAVYSTLYLFDTLNKLLMALLLGLALDTWLSIQAYLKARRLKSVELKPYQRWWVYLLFTLVVYGLPDGYGTLFPSRIRSFQIPSESMVPNLLVGDRLVADGWSYWKAEPKRGDIIVFDYPKDPSTKFVKRLVGLPGDVIQLKQGELYINNKIVPQRRTERPNFTDGAWTATEFVENLDGVEHTIYRSQPENNENYGPQTVPAGHYFMMGDNRDRSSDSRVWGFVKREQVIGRMVYIYFSWDKNSYERMRADNPADLGAAVSAGMRWDRIGMQVR